MATQQWGRLLQELGSVVRRWLWSRRCLPEAAQWSSVVGTQVIRSLVWLLVVWIRCAGTMRPFLDLCLRGHLVPFEKDTLTLRP